MTPHVTVVLLNWKNSDDTLACLAQLMQLQYANITIVVVDNHSADGSEERISDAFPSVALIRSSHNRGFAGGVNLGIQYALAQQTTYVLLLNSDVTFSADLVTELIAEAQKHPDLGILSPIIYTSRSQRRIWMYGFRVNKHGIQVVGQDRIEHEHPQALNAITGCAMLIPASTLRRIGLLDEHFFFYGEDIDYGLRVCAARLTVRLAPMAWVEHAPHGATQKRSGTRQFFLARSRMLLIRKYWPQFQPLIVVLSEARETLRIFFASARYADLRAIAGYSYGLWSGLVE